jgi:hypothetical protein
MMVRALVVSVVQVIMVHVVSPAQQGSMVVQKYQVRNKLFLQHIFIVAPFILKIHWVLHTSKCTNYILCISLKLFTLKHLKCSYMFRSLDHPQGARIIPCQSCMLKLWICHYIYQWCGSISCCHITTILGTSHMIREVLQSETWSLSSGDHRRFKRSTRKTRPITRDNNTNTTATTTTNNNNNNNNKFESCTRKSLDIFTTKDSYTWNITHNMESTAGWNLKSEQWGSPLVQEKCEEEKACDKRQYYYYY